jgi:hypothetical protein
MVAVGIQLYQSVRTPEQHQRLFYGRSTNQLSTKAAKMVKVVYGYITATLTIFPCHSLHNALFLPPLAVPIQTPT